MSVVDGEDKTLRELALDDANILTARQRTERELRAALDALEEKSQALAASNAMLRATLESTFDAIIATDGAGNVIAFNEKFARMWRAPPEMMRPGQADVLRQVAEEQVVDPESFVARVLEIHANELPESFDVLRFRDGRVFERFSKIQMRDGVPDGRVWSFRDITDRARIEDEHRQTQVALRETDRRKDEFLATLAHELRNPLAPIRQAALISQSAAASDAQKRWSHEVIARQVQHMSLLLDDLLDISRITRGTLELRKLRTGLAAIIEAAVETARPAIDSKRHALELDLPDDPIELEADPLRLAQVLSNLLTNAAKYTDPDGSIRVVARQVGGHVFIRVIDTGIGISPATLPHIFQMFSQVKSAQDRSDGGLGIGLALSRGLVALHGGRLEARSDGLGLGSEFMVQLPVGMHRAAGATSGADSAAHQPIEKRRVLVADDNFDSGASLAMLLRLAGHEVEFATNGPEALQAFERVRPDCAILDIGMPGLNGYEVARRIRAATAGRKVTLIAVTGWGQETDKARALESGFDHHFTKPVEPAALNVLIGG